MNVTQDVKYNLIQAQEIFSKDTTESKYVVAIDR